VAAFFFSPRRWQSSLMPKLRSGAPMAQNINGQTGFGGGRPDGPLRKPESITRAVKQCAAAARPRFPVKKAYLFGPWAKGTANFHSGADVCFFVESWGEKNRVVVSRTMTIMSLEFVWAVIETHVFLASDMEGEIPLIKEILKYGIEI
jgi:predicted nucleotidyltransferase